MKKTDTLADWLNAWTYDERPIYDGISIGEDNAHIAYGDKTGLVWQRQQKLGFRMALRRAERVSLDNAFMAEIAKRTIAQPAEMLAMSSLAMLPFKEMLVEWDDNVRIRAVSEAADAMGGSYSYDPKIDYGRAGLLFERLDEDKPGAWLLTHVSDSDGSLPVWPYASAFAMDGNYIENWNEGKNEAAKTPFVKNLLASGWGYVENGDTSGIQYAIHDELLARGAAVPEPRFFLPTAGAILGAQALTHHSERLALEVVTTIATQSAHQASGKLRWGVAILASLNTVPVVRVPRQAKGSFQHRLHNVPKLSTTHVRIDAHAGHEVAVYERHMHEATGRHNRRHEVRGHWRAIDTRRANTGSKDYWMCPHQIADSDGLYALCGRCGHLLRWIDHHERGDEKLGYVFKDGYDVRG